MSQVYWTPAAEGQWIEVWLGAPLRSNEISALIQFGPTQADMSAEVNWLDSLGVADFQLLGEGRSNSSHRIFISELNLLYELFISIDDMRVTVIRFLNLNTTPPDK